MKHHLTAAILAATFFLAAPLPVNGKPFDLETRFSLVSGYRIDYLRWNIAGYILGNNVNILSELTWQDLQIYQLKAAGTVIINNLSLKASLDFGFILKGENQDSDYWGDNRTLEFSRSNNSSDDDFVLDASLGVGYRFLLAAGSVSITPLFGVSLHKQNVRMTNGFQTLSRIGQPLGPFTGLNSTYQTRWLGPWAGIDLTFKRTERLTISVGFSFHLAAYYAEADWNLRTDFAHPKSYEHLATGLGFIIFAGLDIALTGNWSIILNLNYQRLGTWGGLDRTFLASGDVAVTRLNEVNWSSFAVMAGVQYAVNP